MPLLARHFAEVAATKYGLEPRTFTPRAMAALGAYAWPGNVRELANTVEKATILAGGPAIDVDDLPEGIATLATAEAPVPAPAPAPAPDDDGPADAPPDLAAGIEEGTPFAEAKRRAIVRFETDLITRELARSRGIVSRAARALGLHRQSLQHKMKELGIDPESFRDTTLRDGAG